MARRRYLIAYDIRDPVRLRQVAKLMEAFGSRIQYSVFLSDLSLGELAQLKIDAQVAMKVTVDSVMVVDLGPVGAQNIEFIGPSRGMPMTGPVVV